MALCLKLVIGMDESREETSTIKIAPKFSDILIIFQPWGAYSAQHRQGHTNNFPVDTSLIGSYGLINITFSGVKGQ